MVHLEILEQNRYNALKIERLSDFGTGLAKYAVKISWEDTQEPDNMLCQNEAHQLLVNQYRAMHLDAQSQKVLLWASNAEHQQPVESQQGSDAKQACLGCLIMRGCILPHIPIRAERNAP